jgi:Mg/Co/Ni transporter MgtE
MAPGDAWDVAPMLDFALQHSGPISMRYPKANAAQITTTQRQPVEFGRALTVIIREMALGEMTVGDGRKALIKEVILGVLNGIAIGVLVGVIGWFWKGSIVLGVVVGVAMLLNMVAAALSGVLVPYTLKALRIDPALASCIMVTTVTDVAGFFFFLGLAALAMQWWPVGQ